MLGVKLFILCIYPTLCLTGIVLEEFTPEHEPQISSPDSPPSLFLVGPPSEQMKYAEDFLKSLIPSLMEELYIQYFRIPDAEKFPKLSKQLSFRDIPVQFILKREKYYRHFRGKLKHTDFIKFIRLNIEEYSVLLTDQTFDSITGVYTWVGEQDWLVQFYGPKQYPRDLWSDVGYRMKGFSSIAHINLTSSPYTEERFSYILENMSLPAALFFRNLTVYRYLGKVAASNFAEFLRDFFYNPKTYHKLMFKHGPVPYNCPAPPHFYKTIWDYLIIPEIYNTLLFLGFVAVVSIVRYKLRNFQEIEKKMKEKKSD